MAWHMSFVYDALHDVVLASFQDCVLHHALDVARWRQEVEAHLSRFRGPVDLLINLDGLSVKYPAGRAYGRERTDLLARYARRSYRYGGDEMTRMFINTSGVLNGAAVNLYRSREEALRALRAAREADALQAQALAAGKKAV